MIDHELMNTGLQISSAHYLHPSERVFADMRKSQRDTCAERELNIAALKGQTRPFTDLICRDIASFALDDSSAYDKIVSNTGGRLK